MSKRLPLSPSHSCITLQHIKADYKGYFGSKENILTPHVRQRIKGRVNWICAGDRVAPDKVETIATFPVRLLRWVRQDGADVVNIKGFKPDKYVMIAHATLEDKYFKALPESAKTLFVYLCKCRNRLGNPLDDLSFWQTDHQLITATGFSRNQLKRARRALLVGKFIWWASYLPEGRIKGPRYVILDTLFEEIPNHSWRYRNTVSKTDT